MNIRKLFALSMSVVAGLTCMGGCGGGKENKDALLISVFDGGYGTKWATDIAAAFEEKTGIQTEVKPSTYVDGFRTALESGTTEADLFFGKKAHWDLFYKEVKVGSQKFKPIFADLTDIYTSVIPGEDKTIREKLSPDVADLLNFGTEEEPLYYTYSWAIGDMGIVVNNKEWTDSWVYPNTTDELLALCETVKAAGKIPFVYSLDYSYWDGYYQYWCSQYEGSENMARYWAGYDKSGKRYQPELVNLQGALEGLKVLQALLDKDKGYQHAASKSINFTQAQNYLLAGHAVMQPNGDWLETEMQGNYDPDEVDISLKKIPVVSALGTRLGITDKELSAIVSYVDGNGELPSFTSSAGYTGEEVVAAVREARNMFISSANSHIAYVPVYSNKINEAKQFLQFMSSDEGIELYSNATLGAGLPFEYDYLGNDRIQMSAFMQTSHEMMAGGSHYMDNMKDRLRALGGVYFINHENYLGVSRVFSSDKSSSSYLTADQLFMLNYTYMRERWDTIFLTNAGLKN